MRATSGPVLVGEAEQVLEPRHLCYRTEAALYDDRSLPPLAERLTDLPEADDTHRSLAARLGMEVVGLVRGRLVDGTCHVGRLVVHPRHQGRGLGTRLLREIEARFLEAGRFAPFTGHRSEGNLRLGYAEFRRERASPRFELVHLEKRRALLARADR